MKGRLLIVLVAITMTVYGQQERNTVKDTTRNQNQAPYFSQSNLRMIRKGAHEMKGLSIVERLVAGASFQLLRLNKRTSLDVNPWIGYRTSPNLTVGIGWNERSGFGTRHFRFGSRRSIYGPRVFVDFRFPVGFSVRGEIEYMNAPISSVLQPFGARHREWVWGSFAGVKKDFKLYRAIRGNVQILYNVYSLIRNQQASNAYTDQLALRLGFEFPLKRKRSVPFDG